MGTGSGVGQGHRPRCPGGAAHTVTKSPSAPRTISTTVPAYAAQGSVGREEAGHRSAP